MPSAPQLDRSVRELLFQGIVIPAHPLALDRNRRFDQRRQRALTRYYLDAGAKGIAIGVHTTQFEIREPEVGLYQPVLELGAETIREYEKTSGDRIVKVAGVVGNAKQALSEAALARDLGYDLALVSLGAFRNASNVEMIDHLASISSILPYLDSTCSPRLADDAWTLNFESSHGNRKFGCRESGSLQSIRLLGRRPSGSRVGPY